ncbi:hypothetical protein DIPPA_01040 [Diplonema papillatum]|nr:hypothetical protein DIPPA_01040 [Diplonema papillatum]
MLEPRKSGPWRSTRCYVSRPRRKHPLPPSRLAYSLKVRPIYNVPPSHPASPRRADARRPHRRSMHRVALQELAAKGPSRLVNRALSDRETRDFLLTRKGFSWGQLRAVLVRLATERCNVQDLSYGAALGILAKQQEVSNASPIAWWILEECRSKRITLRPSVLSLAFAAFGQSTKPPPVGCLLQAWESFRRSCNNAKATSHDAECILKCFIPHPKEFKHVYRVLVKVYCISATPEMMGLAVRSLSSNTDEVLSQWQHIRTKYPQAAFTNSVLSHVSSCCVQHKNPAAALDVLCIAADNGVRSSALWEAVLRQLRPVSSNWVARAHAEMVACGVIPSYTCQLLYLEAAVDATRRSGDDWCQTAFQLIKQVRCLQGPHPPDLFVAAVERLCLKLNFPEAQFRALLVEAADEEPPSWLAGWSQYVVDARLKPDSSASPSSSSLPPITPFSATSA